MHAKHLIALITLSFLICQSTVFTQTPTPAPGATQTEQQKQAQKEIEKKALALLDDIVADAQSLRLGENRAFVTATAADLLWTRDEKRARTLFTDALNTLANARASSGINAEENVSNRSYASYAGYMATALRQQLLQMVARHDARLAFDLLRTGSASKQMPATPASPVEVNLDRGMNEDARLEQTLIAQIAATDPQTAFRVAQESLAKGISPSLLSTLHILQRKDAETATKLANSIVERLRNTNFQSNPEAAYVAAEMLNMNAHPERYAQQAAMMGEPALVDAAKDATKDTAKKTQPLLNDTVMRDLTEAIVSAILNNSAGREGFLYQSSTLLPLIEKYAPTRAPQVRRKLADVKQLLDPQERAFMKYQEQMQNGTTDSLLQAASQAPAEVRDMLYQTAAWKALAQKDTARARQIIQDNVSNAQERTQLLAQIDRQALTQALKQGKLDEARQMLRERGTRSKKDQAMLLAMLAQAAAKKGERKFALDLLDEARQLVPNAQAQNQDQLDAQLAVAAAYTFVEPTRSFEIVEPMIDQANELIRAAALLDKFGNSGQRFFRNGELILTMAGAASPMIRSRYGRALTLLANADFDRARGDAGRFQQPELRIMARLLIAQGALDTRQQESTTPQSDFDEMPGGMEVFSMGGAVLIGTP